MNALTPVVLVYGAFCTGEVFETLAAAFRQRGHVVVVPTMPGRHVENAVPAGISVDDRVEFIRRLVGSTAERYSSKVALIGHSMGGIVVAKVAEHNPVVAGLGLLGSAPSWEHSLSLAAQLRLLRYLDTLPQGYFKPSGEDFKDLFLNDVRDEASVLRHVSGFRPESWKIVRQLASHQYGIYPRRLTENVIVVAGELDQVMTKGSQKSLGLKFGKKTLFVPCGHLSMLWNQEAILALTSFVSGLTHSKESSLATAAE